MEKIFIEIELHPEDEECKARIIEIGTTGKGLERKFFQASQFAGVWTDLQCSNPGMHSGDGWYQHRLHLHLIFKKKFEQKRAEIISKEMLICELPAALELAEKQGKQEWTQQEWVEIIKEAYPFKWVW